MTSDTQRTENNISENFAPTNEDYNDMPSEVDSSSSKKDIIIVLSILAVIAAFIAIVIAVTTPSKFEEVRDECVRQLDGKGDISYDDDYFTIVVKYYTPSDDDSSDSDDLVSAYRKAWLAESEEFLGK